METWKIIDKAGERTFESESAVLEYIKKELSGALEKTPIANAVVIDPGGTRCDVHISIRLEEQLASL